MGAQIPSMFLNFIASDIDWKYNTEPEKSACLSSEGQRCYWPRGKVLGGTSVLNGMMYIRGNREDYDDWAAMGNPGWSYKDVLPFFKKSENNLQIDEVGKELHGTGGLMPVSKFPYNPPLSYAILKAGEELGEFGRLSKFNEICTYISLYYIIYILIYFYIFIQASVSTI